MTEAERLATALLTGLGCLRRSTSEAVLDAAAAAYDGTEDEFAAAMLRLTATNVEAGTWSG